ncbi:hypothetical protein BDQ17DRAFT_1359807 [Cyathus striatus]|nr:hypothetical protein BDQ17DRAFT_1359807 [Cyathus striatus]
MPPRQAKIHHIQLRTHKLCVLVTAQPSDTIMSLKHIALDALTSDVMHPEDVDMDLEFLQGLNSVRDFELVRSKGRPGASTGEYETLDPGKQLREYGLPAWDRMIIQFRSKETGTLLPVNYALPPIDDEDDDHAASVVPPSSDADPPLSAVSKGKRKAMDDDFDDI